MEEAEKPGEQEKDEHMDQSSEAEARGEEGSDEPEREEERPEGSEEELLEPESKDEQPARAEAKVDAGAEAQEEETATGEERGAVPKVPEILHQDGVEAIMDIGQAARKGRGRPRKTEAVGAKELEEPIPSGLSKGSVTDIGARVCVDPEGNGAIMNVGGEGGLGLPGVGRDEQLVPGSGDG